jgi:hypothetical protein
VYTYPGGEALASDKCLETHTRIKELEGVQKAGDAKKATREAVAKFSGSLSAWEMVPPDSMDDLANDYMLSQFIASVHEPSMTVDTAFEYLQVLYFWRALIIPAYIYN